MTGRESYIIEMVKPQYDAALSSIIQQVGAEFGAVGEGFGPGDEEVKAMSQHYCESRSSQYYVALLNGAVVGGCGVAPFNDSEEICELRKLFLLPGARGLGIGRALTEVCITFASSVGFSRCYLDTLKRMEIAVKMYQKMGFKMLSEPLAGTMHGACDVWMLKRLD